MHNCKATKELITEIALNGEAQTPDEALARELRDCAECHEEFVALRQTLRFTARSLEFAMPAESFWPGYQQRLEQKIGDSISSPSINAAISRSWLRRFVTAAVPVPVPAAIALMMVFGVLLVFAVRAQQQNPSAQQPPTVVSVPVQVPVIQERIVTRVVFRDRDKRSKRASQNSNALAKAQEQGETTLVGFQPLDEVRLTVIKGGDQDEK